MLGHCHEHTGLVIAQYESKWDPSVSQEILPIGVIRCACAKVTPVENLPWVTLLLSGRLRKYNWCNVLAQCCVLINARSIGYQILKNFIANVQWATKCCK